MKDTLFVIIVVGAFLGAAFGGALIARALEGEGTVTTVSQEELSSQARELKEEIFNLRQKVLEQGIGPAMENLTNGSGAARLTKDQDLLLTVCAEAQAELAADDVLWTKIREFWPLGPEKLEKLENFRKMHGELCAGVIQ